jgi:ubiquinone/menaquinone biosynthesis C-methylase UbiE
MGFYARRIFPRLMHWSMSRPEFALERRRVLADVHGDVLEIGFGTGLNLPHYPVHARKITAVDPNPGTLRLAEKQLAASPIQVEHRVLSSERLPMADGSFDSIVSTFTLCSIKDIAAALREVRRVLKPDGRFFFLEHGLSPETRIARWQHRLTPLMRVIGEGCHLDRPIRRLVEQAGFRVAHCEEHYLPGVPKVGGYLYRGVAEQS